ncbi:MAG: aminofutalosine synthase MqnE [Bacteroidia bacterium]|nr:aminofutalosine synthase MqnE [Bacteroidia bacterium]
MHGILLNKTILANGTNKTDIIKKIHDGERLTPEEGIRLFYDFSLPELSYLAELVNIRKSGNKVYFNRNFHIEPTNVCVYTCAFCSYSRLIKHRSEGWELSIEQILQKVREFDGKPVTEVHITGGVIPTQDLKFYTELFQKIKQHRPELHIKALTPVEMHYIFKKAKVTVEEGLKILADAGLDSMPGGGAELFDEEIREKIAGGKCSSQVWLDIHRSWHKMGKKSNATMLYGHIEKYEHRIDHMERLRRLQDETAGFQAFIPLKFRNKNNQMSDVPEVSVTEDLKNYAVARIYLDNFPHLKTYWAMIGRETAQMALQFGCDDLDGTIDDTTKIYSMAGAEEQNPTLTTEQIKNIIISSGKIPVERDSLYHILN